jgi:hypothetical protein
MNTRREDDDEDKRRRRKWQERDRFGRESGTSEEEFEDILRDGETLHVPLFLMDGSINPDLNEVQKAVALDAGARQRTFSLAAQRFGLQDAAQLHRPGWRFNATADAVEATHEREAAHVEYLLRLRDAYKSPPPPYGREVTGAGSSGPRGEREGDSVCVPDRSHQDAMTMDEVYRAYDLEISQRWRTP